MQNTAQPPSPPPTQQQNSVPGDAPTPTAPSVQVVADIMAASSVTQTTQGNDKGADTQQPEQKKRKLFKIPSREEVEKAMFKPPDLLFLPSNQHPQPQPAPTVSPAVTSPYFTGVPSTQQQNGVIKPVVVPKLIVSVPAKPVQIPQVDKPPIASSTTALPPALAKNGIVVSHRQKRNPMLKVN